MLGRIFLRKTGIQFSGKCSNGARTRVQRCLASNSGGERYPGAPPFPSGEQGARGCLLSRGEAGSIPARGANTAIARSSPRPTYAHVTGAGFDPVNRNRSSKWRFESSRAPHPGNSRRAPARLKAAPGVSSETPSTTAAVVRSGAGAQPPCLYRSPADVASWHTSVPWR